jgi:hypothetical protein
MNYATSRHGRTHARKEKVAGEYYQDLTLPLAMAVIESRQSQLQDLPVGQGAHVSWGTSKPPMANSKRRSASGRTVRSRRDSLSTAAAHPNSFWPKARSASSNESMLRGEIPGELG